MTRVTIVLLLDEKKRHVPHGQSQGLVSLLESVGIMSTKEGEKLESLLVEELK